MKALQKVERDRRAGRCRMSVSRYELNKLALERNKAEGRFERAVDKIVRHYFIRRKPT